MITSEKLVSLKAATMSTHEAKSTTDSTEADKRRRRGGIKPKSQVIEAIGSAPKNKKYVENPRSTHEIASTLNGVKGGKKKSGKGKKHQELKLTKKPNFPVKAKEDSRVVKRTSGLERTNRVSQSVKGKEDAISIDKGAHTVSKSAKFENNKQKKGKTRKSKLPKSDKQSDISQTDNREVHKDSFKVSSSGAPSSLELAPVLDLGIGVYDGLEFYCDECPVELNHFDAASAHIIDFGHKNMSVVYGGLNDAIKCQSCGEADLNNLNSVLLESNNVGLCCSSCLTRSGFDPLIYSFASEDKLLRYVDNMYRLNSLKCFRCGSRKNLGINQDKIPCCAKCISKDADLRKQKFVKRHEASFLSTLFEDPTYEEFKNIIVSTGPCNDPKSSPVKKLGARDMTPSFDTLTQSNKPDKREKENRNKGDLPSVISGGNISDMSAENDLDDNSASKPRKEKKVKKTTSMSSSLPEEKNSAFISTQQSEKTGSTQSSGDRKRSEKKKDKKSKKNENAKMNKDGLKKSSKLDLKSSIPSPISKELLKDLTPDELRVEDKFEKLKKIIKNTLPGAIKLQFDSINEYYSYLTYSLLLEELFQVDICTDVKFEWKDKEFCSMNGSTQKWFQMYVNDDIKHLKKHPFVRDQPIFILRKSDVNLNWSEKPEFWVAHVAGSTLAKVDKRGRQIKVRARKHAVAKKDNQASSFNLRLYPWNSSTFPINEKGDQFAFVPGSNVLGRILNSMNQIENKEFINLILGKSKVKRINFNNRIHKYFNNLNESQKDALQSAFNNSVTILQGPPGSGKTSTIHEIILQLLENLHYYPILVVAASNLAVDNIAEKLMPKYKDIILRITSLSKEREYNMEHPLGEVCLHNKISGILPSNLKDIEMRVKRDPGSVSSSEFSKYLDGCSKYGEQLVKQANIIFATTAGIAGPYLKNVKSMPVIIMDEATQSSEPSTLIPLGAKGCKKVILVGDTAQLSVFTRVKSLEMSLFQRVLENGTYDDPYMLDTQYRMHPDISEFSRREFYDNKLKDGITAEQRKKPTIKYPVFFLDHKGVGALEGKKFSISGEEFGFSWVNIKEVQYIERMVEKLIVDHQVAPSSIGVMTGYAAQRDLIVNALEKNSVINPYRSKITRTVDKEDLSEKKNVTVCNVNGIVVATIDAFQGREMDFVLLSTVRSNVHGNIGFMSDKRRMNVALTRAKYSFIICGNADCLSSNMLWNKYIGDLRSKNYVKTSINDY